MRHDRTAAVARTGGRNEFRNDVWRGLSDRPKRIPSKYFYDVRGCRLFDEICELDEYYLTRTELAIMQAHAPEMAQRIGRGAALVEFGSGSSIKTRILLDQLQRPLTYVPVDIACEHLERTASRLADDYPDVHVVPLCSDFNRPISLPVEAERVVVYFPGSTIGNLTMREAHRLLSWIRELASPGGGLLLGADLVKSPRRLEAAYNDHRGVTARFNLNLLARINRELGGNFQLDRFDHRAWFNADRSRIEMHLVSREDQVVSVAGRPFELQAGEAIVTEYSHKYSVNDLSRLARAAGLAIDTLWTDPDDDFAVVYLRPRATA